MADNMGGTHWLVGVSLWVVWQSATDIDSDYRPGRRLFIGFCRRPTSRLTLLASIVELIAARKYGPLKL